jgi:RNA-binding protein 25
VEGTPGNPRTHAHTHTHTHAHTRERERERERERKRKREREKERVEIRLPKHQRKVEGTPGNAQENKEREPLEESRADSCEEVCVNVPDKRVTRISHIATRKQYISTFSRERERERERECVCERESERERESE